MKTHNLQFTIQIASDRETIFDLVADMPNYGVWLPKSSAFGGTVDVKPYPVMLGTTYVDLGAGDKPGVVTEFERPAHLGFRHTIQLPRPFTSGVEAQIRYTFESNDSDTLVLRELALTTELRGLLQLATPLMLAAFRKENERTLACLKRYAERDRSG